MRAQRERRAREHEEAGWAMPRSRTAPISSMARNTGSDPAKAFADLLNLTKTGGRDPTSIGSITARYNPCCLSAITARCLSPLSRDEASAIMNMGTVLEAEMTKDLRQFTHFSWEHAINAFGENVLKIKLMLLDGRVLEGLVDTGAGVSAFAQKCYEKLPDGKRPKARRSRMSLVSACKTTMSSHGVVNLPVRLQEVTKAAAKFAPPVIIQDVEILRHLNYDFVLGMPALKALGAIVDTGDGKVFLKNADGSLKEVPTSHYDRNKDTRTPITPVETSVSAIRRVHFAEELMPGEKPMPGLLNDESESEDSDESEDDDSDEYTSDDDDENGTGAFELQSNLKEAELNALKHETPFARNIRSHVTRQSPQ